MPGHYPDNVSASSPDAPWNQCGEDSHRLEELQELRGIIGDAWEAWAWFNGQLHQLDPPKEIVAAWDMIRPWLEAKGTAIGAELAEEEGL